MRCFCDKRLCWGIVVPVSSALGKGMCLGFLVWISAGSCTSASQRCLKEFGLSFQTARILSDFWLLWSVHKRSGKPKMMFLALVQHRQQDVRIVLNMNMRRNAPQGSHYQGPARRVDRGLVSLRSWQSGNVQKSKNCAGRCSIRRTTMMNVNIPVGDSLWM